MRENAAVEHFEDSADGRGVIKLTKTPAPRLEICSPREPSSSKDGTHRGLVYKSVKHARRVSSDRNIIEVSPRYTVSASRCCSEKHITNRGVALLGGLKIFIDNTRSENDLDDRSFSIVGMAKKSSNIPGGGVGAS